MVATGTPEQVAANVESHTGAFLAPLLGVTPGEQPAPKKTAAKKAAAKKAAPRKTAPTKTGPRKRAAKKA